MSRYLRRVSSVQGAFTPLKRFSIVPVLSSAARTPFPGAVNAFTVVSISCAVMAFSLLCRCQLTRGGLRNQI
jgi:hypothetical protein